MDDSSNCPSYEEAHSGPVRPEEDLVAGYLELVPERRGSHAQPAPGRPEKAEFKIFERPYNLDQNLFELCLNLLFTFGFLGEFNVFFSYRQFLYLSLLRHLKQALDIWTNEFIEFPVPRECSMALRRSLVLKMRIIWRLTKARMSAIWRKYCCTLSLISWL